MSFIPVLERERQADIREPKPESTQQLSDQSQLHSETKKKKKKRKGGGKEEGKKDIVKHIVL